MIITKRKLAAIEVENYRGYSKFKLEFDEQSGLCIVCTDKIAPIELFELFQLIESNFDDRSRVQLDEDQNCTVSFMFDNEDYHEIKFNNRKILREIYFKDGEHVIYNYEVEDSPSKNFFECIAFDIETGITYILERYQNMFLEKTFMDVFNEMLVGSLKVFEKDLFFDDKSNMLFFYSTENNTFCPITTANLTFAYLIKITTLIIYANITEQNLILTNIKNLPASIKITIFSIFALMDNQSHKVLIAFDEEDMQEYREYEVTANSLHLNYYANNGDLLIKKAVTPLTQS